MDLFPQIFEVPKQNFKAHLDVSENYRILFSGRFGVGKTTFLKHFFNESDFLEQYNCFHLYPVNYSILENADIMSYLKYDILHELLINHGTQLLTEPKGENPNENAIVHYGIKHFKEIISLMVLAIPKIGKQYFHLIEEWNKMQGLYDSYLEAIPKSDEYTAIEAFFETFHGTEGELYEENFITQIITNALESMKGHEDNQKENVLILDDLDRIDPQHIFRLFNVFTAQFDQHNTGNGKDNKFGFSKVIFICNVDNIRSIFHHFYGSDTNFSGYIDKFYSKEIFRFDNRENLGVVMTNVVNQLRIYDNGTQIDKFPLENVKEILENIFLDLIDSGYVNLRQFLRYEDIYLSMGKINFDSTSRNYAIAYPYIIIIEILLKYFDDVNYLKNILAKCKVRPNSTRRQGSYFEDYLIPLSDMDNHMFTNIQNNRRGNEGESHTFSYNNHVINYKLIGNRQRYITYFYVTNSESFYVIDFYELLIKAIENLEKVKYFD